MWIADRIIRAYLKEVRSSVTVTVPKAQKNEKLTIDKRPGDSKTKKKSPNDRKELERKVKKPKVVSVEEKDRKKEVRKQDASDASLVNSIDNDRDRKKLISDLDKEDKKKIEEFNKKK